MLLTILAASTTQGACVNSVLEKSKHQEGWHMPKKKDYDALARIMVDNVGGPDNIESYRHCITRVRFRLKNEDLAHDDVLKATDGIVDVIKSGGEYMVVIGTDVEDAYDAVVRLLGEKSTSTAASAGADADGKKANVVMRVLNVITGSIGPALNMICAGGILKGVLSLVSTMGWLASDSGLYTVLNATGDAVFYFLPVIIGYNFCKQMGVDGFLGLIIGAILTYPGITGAEISLFGITSTATYSTSVIPVILICAVAVPIFKFLRSHMSRNVSGFLVPAITLLVVMPLGIAFIGPFANWLGNMVNLFITTLMTAVPLIGGAVFGGLYQVLVLFGIHQAVTSFAFMNLLSGNADPIMAICCMVSFSQIGAVLAIYLRTRNAKLKEVALPAFISGVFGVTEPAIYGVTLPRIKYFVVSCIGGALMGAFLMVTNTLMYAFTGLGVFSIIGFVNPADPTGSVLMDVICIVIGFVFSFAVTFVMYRDEGSDLAGVEDAASGSALAAGATDASASSDEAGAGSDVPASAGSIGLEAAAPVQKTVLDAPIPGTVMPLSEVPDAAFSSGAMGHGFAIEPSEGKLFAPADGVATVVFPTGHAIGITTDTGVEVLVHVGMDTVNLQGSCFTTHIKQGDAVKRGQLLLEFDIEGIKAAGYSTIAPMIVTNEAEVGEPVVDLAAATITVGAWGPTNLD